MALLAGVRCRVKRHLWNRRCSGFSLALPLRCAGHASRLEEQLSGLFIRLSWCLRFMHAGFAMLETGCCRAKQLGMQHASHMTVKEGAMPCQGTRPTFL